MMKEKEFMNYEAPQVEVIEVEVEKGFTMSSMSSGTPDYGYGGNLSGNQ